jgi:hypothetical protein
MQKTNNYSSTTLPVHSLGCLAKGCPEHCQPDAIPEPPAASEPAIDKDFRVFGHAWFSRTHEGIIEW